MKFCQRGTYLSVISHIYLVIVSSIIFLKTKPSATGAIFKYFHNKEISKSSEKKPLFLQPPHPRENVEKTWEEDMGGGVGGEGEGDEKKNN